VLLLIYIIKYIYAPIILATIYKPAITI